MKQRDRQRDRQQAQRGLNARMMGQFIGEAHKATKARRTFMINLSCGHEVSFETPCPAVGEWLTCRVCGRSAWRIAQALPGVRLWSSGDGNGPPDEPDGGSIMVDFTALTVADGTSDDIKREVASKYADSPVNGWLAESFQTGVPKVLDGINPEDTDEVEAAVRGCAKLLGIGYRVSAVKDSTAHPGKKVLSFVGKNKKNVQPRGPLTDEQKAQRAASRAANKAAKEKAAAATPEAPKSARGSKR